MYEAYLALLDGILLFWNFLISNQLGSYLIVLVIFGLGAVIVRNIISD